MKLLDTLADWWLRRRGWALVPPPKPIGHLRKVPHPSLSNVYAMIDDKDIVRNVVVGVPNRDGQSSTPAPDRPL